MTRRRGPSVRLDGPLALEPRSLLTTLIAIVDSGVDLNDPSVVPYLDLTSAYDAYNKKTYAEVGASAILDTSLAHGHGSVVANMTAQGIVAAAAASGSTPDVKILPIRDTSSGLNIDANSVIRGVYWAADRGASVINLSVNFTYNPTLNDPGAPNDGRTLVDAIAYAQAKGAVVVTAPGNSGRNIEISPVFPPFADDSLYSNTRPTPTNVLVAAAVDAGGTLTSASNWGRSHVDLGAYSGPEGFTSYSAGYASGVAGVVADLLPRGSSPARVIDVLTSTVTPKAQSVGAWSVTGGVLNPAAAVAKAKQGLSAADGTFALAAGKPATSSSIESSSYGPALAVDPSTSTRWSSGQWMQGASTAWFAVDLQDYYHVTDVRLNWERAYAVDYQVQVSDDGQAWTTIKSVTGNQSAGPVTLSGLSGDGRFVRVYATKTSAGSNNYSLFDFQVNGAKQADLARGKEATSSSVESPAFSPAAALDGNATSRWSSGQWMQGTSTAWLSVDLGSVSTIRDVRLAWETAYAADFQIQASVDGQAWTTLKDVRGNASAGPAYYSDLGGVGRYVRIVFTRTSQANNNYSLYDFNVYGSPLTNLAAGKVATSSSNESNIYAPTMAIDPSQSTRWSSGQWMQKGSTGWIAIDLGAKYNLTSVALNWEAAYAVDYQIQVSDDGQAWTTIRSVVGNARPGVDVQGGLSGSGRFVRIYCTRLNWANNYSLYDVQVFGAPSTSASTSAVAAAPIATAPIAGVGSTLVTVATPTASTPAPVAPTRRPIPAVAFANRSPSPVSWQTAFARPTRPGMRTTPV